MEQTMTEMRKFLRHALATLAYRGAKVLRGAPAGFAEYGSPQSPRTPAIILAHMVDLMDWSLSMVEGRPAWHNSDPLPWEGEVQRFFAAVKKLDDFLASDRPLAAAAEKLFQGPIADALTHVGQLAMLRRLAGCPMPGENYFVAEITVGRVGFEQAKPVKELE